MLVEAIASLAVGAALLWLVIQPMVVPSVPSPVEDDPPDAEETPRGRALLAIREIEFDRATGKLSDDDFRALHAKYSSLAVQALDAADRADAQVAQYRSDAVEAMVAARLLPEAGQARFCTSCGAALVAGAAFCSRCGRASAT